MHEQSGMIFSGCPEYPVAEGDQLGRSGAAPVPLSGFVRRIVRRLFG
jgi:hypothetical protein